MKAACGYQSTVAAGGGRQNTAGVSSLPGTPRVPQDEWAEGVGSGQFAVGSLGQARIGA